MLSVGIIPSAYEPNSNTFAIYSWESLYMRRKITVTPPILSINSTGFNIFFLIGLTTIKSGIFLFLFKRRCSGVAGGIGMSKVS